MNGAVQGDATATASTPVRPWSTTAAAAQRCDAAGQHAGELNSPSRLKPISANSSAKAATNSGDCSEPQPRPSPAARNASSTPASATNDSTTPAWARPPATR